MPFSPINTSEVAILGRVLEPDKPTLPAEAARAILALDFSQADKDHMRELSAKARAGTLTPDEQVAINNYERVGHLLNIVQSKARRSLSEEVARLTRSSSPPRPCKAGSYRKAEFWMAPDFDAPLDDFKEYMG